MKKWVKRSLMGLGILILIPLLIIAFYVIALTPPFFPDKLIDRFTTEDGRTVVFLENIERIRLGSETNIFIRVAEGDYQSEAHKIDHNGRLKYSRDYKLHISKDRNWVRTCKKAPKIERGIRVWKEYSPDMMPRHEKWSRGRWVIEEAGEDQGGRVYSFYCDAYVNYRKNVLIRKVYPHSTREQRESELFAPKAAGSMEDRIDGERVVWEPLIKAAGDFD